MPDIDARGYRTLGEIAERIVAITPLGIDGTRDITADPMFVRRATLLRFMPFERIQALYPTVTSIGDVFSTADAEWRPLSRRQQDIRMLLRIEISTMAALAYRHEREAVTRRLDRLNELVWLYGLDVDLLRLPFERYAMPAVDYLLTYTPSKVDWNSWSRVIDPPRGIELATLDARLPDEAWFQRMAVGAPWRPDCAKGCHDGA